jgi:hypothetical protein
MDGVFEFGLRCTCGVEITGGFYSIDDKVDRLHCDCGLVWEVKKPYKESE